MTRSNSPWRLLSSRAKSRRQKKCRRSLRLEALETRQLMAGDAVSSFADDRLEPNDSVFFATILPATDYFVGDCNLTSGDRDVFSWIAPVDGTVEFGVNFQHALGDVDLEVKYDATGAVYRANGVVDNELLALPATRGQWFTITVYGYRGASNPRYDLVIRPLHPTIPGAVQHVPADQFEINDTMQSATPLHTGDVVLNDLTLEGYHEIRADPRIDNDWFRWTPSADGQATVNLRFLHRVLDANVEVYDQSGRLIQGAYSTDDDEQLQFTAVAGQFYYLRVFSVWEGALFDYDLSIDGQDIRPDRFEANNGLRAAAPLSRGDQTLTGMTIHAANNHDWYVWTAPASGTLTVDVGFRHAAGNLALKVYDDSPTPQQLAVSRTNTDNERVTIAVQAGRRYYIRVYGENGALSPNYSLALNGPESPAYAALDRVLEVDGDDATSKPRMSTLGDRIARQAVDALFDARIEDDLIPVRRMVRRQPTLR